MAGPPALTLALVRFGSPSPAWKACSILLHSTVYAPLPNHLFLRFQASGILHLCLQVSSCKGYPFLHSLICVGYYLYFPLLKDPHIKYLYGGFVGDKDSSLAYVNVPRPAWLRVWALEEGLHANEKDKMK